MRREPAAGLPRVLRDLSAAMATANDRVFDLHAGSQPEAFDRVADAIWAAFQHARDLARPKTITGCDRHPQGAVDPEPPRGWGACLLCNTHRRRATAPDRPLRRRRR